MSRLNELNAIIDSYGLQDTVIWLEPHDMVDPHVLEVNSHVERGLGNRSASVWMTDGHTMTQTLPDEPEGTSRYEHHIRHATYAIMHVTAWTRGRKTDSVGSLVLCEDANPEVLREKLEAVFGYSLTPAS